MTQFDIAPHALKSKFAKTVVALMSLVALVASPFGSRVFVRERREDVLWITETKP